MTNLMILERNEGLMKPVDPEIQQILDRIEKLSLRPQNPGLAYQNLEAIHALADTLREKLGTKAQIRF